MGRRQEVPLTAEQRNALVVQQLQAAAAWCQSDTGRPYEPLRPSSEHRRFDPPRAPMLAGAGGLRLLMRIPGFVDQFDVQVPGKYLQDGSVTCTCTASTVLEMSAVVACVGGCGRYFLQLPDAVLVARFPLDDEAEAA